MSSVVNATACVSVQMAIEAEVTLAHFPEDGGGDACPEFYSIRWDGDIGTGSLILSPRQLRALGDLINAQLAAPAAEATCDAGGVA